MNYKRVIKSYSRREKNFSLKLIYALLALIFIQIVKSTYISYAEERISNMYTEVIPESFIGINPLYANLNNHNSDLSSLLYRGLVKYNPDKKIMEGDLANFIVNEDSTQFKFNLKENQKWSNGDNITNQDIIFTFNSIIKDPNFDNIVLKSNFEGVEIELSNENEILFKLDQPNQFFLSNLTVGILPQSIEEELKNKQFITEENCNTCLFSGKFELDSIKEKDGITEVILENDSELENIRFLIGNDIQNKKIDYNSNFYSTNNDNFYKLPKYSALFINTNQEFLKNIHLRKAIKSIIKQKEFDLLLENKISINSPYFQFEDIKNSNEQDAESIKKSLIENGYEYKGENLTYNDKPIRLSIIQQKYEINIEKNQENQILADYFKKSFAKIGIQIVIHNYDRETFQDILLSKNFDLALFGHDLGNNLDSYSFWHSTQTYPGGLNISNYQNLITDKVLENLRKTSNQEKTKDLVIELNNQLNQFIPAIFLFTDKHGFEVDNKIKNRKILESYTKPSDRFFDINLWTINNF